MITFDTKPLIRKPTLINELGNATFVREVFASDAIWKAISTCTRAFDHMNVPFVKRSVFCYRWVGIKGFFEDILFSRKNSDGRYRYEK